MTVDPGICGFPCVIKARKAGKRMVSLEISGSDCEQIQRLAENLQAFSLKDIFLPLSRNPVYAAAEKSGCHLSCAIPVAVIKAAEVALDLALPRDVHIQFEACQERNPNAKIKSGSV
ncbi:MAG: hypothetical protein JRE72_17475 [Deltaproteobacteria bacterium]|nr:hypothetical protein [Deltaproteobacteria bacterium]